jgi:DALR anticodon binding domain
VKHWLHKAVNIQAQNQHFDSSEPRIFTPIYRVHLQSLPISEISVKLDANHTQIAYVSAIAPLLEKSWRQPAPEIAQKLIERLIQTTQLNNSETQFSSLQSVWKNFLFEANSVGWITLKISDQGLAKWLEILISFLQNLKNLSDQMNSWHENPQIYLRDSTASRPSLGRITHGRDLPCNSTELLLTQHSHARCCSLLQLGMQEGLIQLTAFPRGLGIGEPLPWLTENASLRSQHPSERHLIRQICQTLDEIFLVNHFSEPKKALKQAVKLSQAFSRFDADCLIFNEVKVDNPALAQVRLGLVDLVRSLLHLLLEDGLGIAAPPQL